MTTDDLFYESIIFYLSLFRQQLLRTVTLLSVRSPVATHCRNLVIGLHAAMAAANTEMNIERRRTADTQNWNTRSIGHEDGVPAAEPYIAGVSYFISQHVRHLGE